MGRFWNLRTKLVGVLVLVLSGTFLLQTVIHEHNETQLLAELEKVAQDIANDTSNLITRQIEQEIASIEPGRAPRLPQPEMRMIVTLRHQGRPVGATRVRVPAGRSPGSGGDKVVFLQVDQEYARRLAQRFRESADELRGTRAPADPQQILERFVEALQDPASAPPASALADAAPVVSDLERRIAAAEVDVEEELAFAREHEDRVRAEGIGFDLDPAPLPSAPFFSSSSADPFPRLERTSPALDITSHIDRVQQLFNDSKRHDLIATVGVFLIGIALAWFLGARVARPVEDVVHGFQRLAEGDFDARVPERPGEEFGHLGHRFNAMVERLREGRELERDLSQRERIQHMGDLAAGVAHDVRNPLNAIHLNIGQIRDEFVPGDDRAKERFLRFTSDVQREVERLNQLVTNFLSLAQPAAEESERVAPNEIVDELFRLLRKEATGRQVELVLDLADGLPTITWNRQEMKSAFLNIAINALQALERSGGQLVVATAKRAGATGDELVVSFVDDGPGIPPEDLERVFVPYYTTRQGGTGLGMAIARRTAERHGGRLELRSAIDAGTSVSFVFPIDAPATGESGEVSA